MHHIRPIKKKLQHCWLFIHFNNLVPFIIGAFVYFNHSNHTVNEKNGVVKPVLVLTSLVSIDLSVEVKSKDITATGEQIHIIILVVIVFLLH